MTYRCHDPKCQSHDHNTSQQTIQEVVETFETYETLHFAKAEHERTCIVLAPCPEYVRLSEEAERAERELGSAIRALKQVKTKCAS